MRGRETGRPVGRLAMVGAALCAALLLAACTPRLDGVHLSITTGNPSAVYHQLGGVLATEWTRDPGVGSSRVLPSAGSGENLDRLLGGQADVGLSAADAAAEYYARPAGHRLRALARIHDDYLQLVVPQDSPVQRLADLRGKRVAVGSPNSGVELIANRLLNQVGISPNTGITASHLTVDAAANALSAGQVDAFFWSGGIPTSQITELAARTQIRLIDLSDVLPAVRTRYPEYGAAIIPASSYRLAQPVTTLQVRNFLLVTDRMTDEVAESLTRGLFAAQPALTRRNIAARSIDVRSGVETMPIPLHPGALEFYRSGTF